MLIKKNPTKFCRNNIVLNKVYIIIKINNGLILNYGSCPSGGATFPISFTTCYNVVAGYQYYNNNIIGIYKHNLSKFVTKGGPTVTIWLFWLAIGY